MELIGNILSSLWFGFLLMAFFGISIFVHELGHYLVARACGMVVDTFSIGFGPSIWQRKINGTTYKIGIFPMGGYVALPQLDPSGMSRIQGEGENQTAPLELPPIAPWKKILVSIAGAVGNILLAIVLAWLVYLIGMPAGPAERSGVVGYVAEDSMAYAEGLRIGDTILAVNGGAVSKWSEVRLAAAFDPEVDLKIRTVAGDERTLHLKTITGPMGENQIPGVDGPDLCMVLRATAGMTADQAGIKPEDLIVRFGGQAIFSKTHLISLVKRAENQPSEIVIKRRPHGGKDADAQEMAFTVTPVRDSERGMVRIGIEFNLAAVEHDTVVRPRPMEQLRGHAMAIFHFLEALGTPAQAKVASQAVGGPVAILVSYWYIVKTSPMLAIWFTGFLNVNLAILNLLPIPVLDGGHICFSLYEMVRRKPLHPRFVSGLVNVFAVLLISLILLISVRDVDRFTPLGRLMRGLFGPDKPVAELVSTNMPSGTNAVTSPE